MASPKTPSWGLSATPVVCLDPLSHRVPPKSSSRSEAWSTSGWHLAHHQPACTLPGAQVGGDAERCGPGCGARADGQVGPAPGFPFPRRPPPPEQRRHCRAGPPHSTHSRLWENSSLLTLLPTGCVQAVFGLSLRVGESLAVSPWVTHSGQGAVALGRNQLLK